MILKHLRGIEALAHDFYAHSRIWRPQSTLGIPDWCGEQTPFLDESQEICESRKTRLENERVKTRYICFKNPLRAISPSLFYNLQLGSYNQKVLVVQLKENVSRSLL